MVWIAMVSVEKAKEEKSASDVLVVKEYLDVFLEDLLGLPPNREIEFTIDLMPSMEPISIPPYKMAPIKLKELKEQLQVLLDKGFIHPSLSPLGSSSTFRQKERWIVAVMH